MAAGLRRWPPSSYIHAENSRCAGSSGPCDENPDLGEEKSVFLTVTLNPALDKTLFVERNTPYDTVRAARSIDLAGGKGVNVARALRTLGAPARALMPLAGHPGSHLADLA